MCTSQSELYNMYPCHSNQARICTYIINTVSKWVTYKILGELREAVQRPLIKTVFKYFDMYKFIFIPGKQFTEECELFIQVTAGLLLGK